MLRLTGSVHVAPDADQLYDDLAATLLGLALESIDARGVFHIALSGGSTPEPFYHRLVTDPAVRHFPWDQTHLWIVDERRVPEDDDRNNYRMIRESLADPVPMKRRQLHPMPVMDGDPATLYEAELRQVFGSDDLPRLDFVLLGMGGDAHTASLFPHSDALDVTDRWIAVNEGDAVTPPPRVTMTYPLLNAARHLVALVTGAKKTDTLRQIEKQLEAGPAPSEMPITGIAPADGDLVWYLDAAAAGVAAGE